MYLKNSILEDVRVALGLDRDTLDFDAELIMHINGALGRLLQNGVIKPTIVTGTTQTWEDIKDPLKVEGNEYFAMVPTFITLSTKLIFDPPPPSTVEYYSRNIDETLWRLQIAYEETTPKPIDTQTY